MKRTRSRGYAYHCEVSLGYFFMEQYYTPNEICDLNMVDLQPQKSLGFFIKKGSPYHDFFKIKFVFFVCSKFGHINNKFCLSDTFGYGKPDMLPNMFDIGLKGNHRAWRGGS